MSAKVRQFFSTAGMTVMALGFGYVIPITAPLSRPQRWFRNMLTIGAMLVALAGHFLPHVTPPTAAATTVALQRYER
jgi:hypothetical protein